MGTEESGIALAVLNGHEVRFNLEEQAVAVDADTCCRKGSQGECVDGNHLTYVHLDEENGILGLDTHTHINVEYHLASLVW